MYEDKIITGILTDIKSHLCDSDSTQLLQECLRLEQCIENCFMSAMTVYRLRKISQLTITSLTENIQNLQIEIRDLIEVLTHLVYWKCEACGKTVDAESENHLELWVNAHKMICKSGDKAIYSAA